MKRRRQLITVHWFPRLNDMNHRHDDDTKLSKPKGAIKGELTNKKERENTLSYFFLLQGRMVLLSSTAVVVTWGFLCVVFDCPCGLSPTPVIVVSSYQSRLQLHVCQRGVVLRERNRAYSDTIPTIHSLLQHQKNFFQVPPHHVPFNCIWDTYIFYPQVFEADFQSQSFSFLPSLEGGHSKLP